VPCPRSEGRIFSAVVGPPSPPNGRRRGAVLKRPPRPARRAPLAWASPSSRSRRSRTCGPRASPQCSSTSCTTAASTPPAPMVCPCCACSVPYSACPGVLVLAADRARAAGWSNVGLSVRSKTHKGSVRYHGLTDSAFACEAACVALDPKKGTCFSFMHFRPGSDLANQVHPRNHEPTRAARARRPPSSQCGAHGGTRARRRSASSTSRRSGRRCATRAS